MWMKFRHKIVFALLKPIFKVYLYFAYGFTYEKYKLSKGPHLILFNHPTNMDPFMVAMSIKGPIYFMANDDLFTIKYFSKIIRYLVAPIPKSKSVRDIQAVKDCIKIVKEGGNISISPEGNRTYHGKLNHVDEAIAKLAKFLKIPVVLYNIYGGFGVNPRFSIYRRRGKTFGKVNKILSVEQINNLTENELYHEIVNGLTIDELALNHKYKSKHLAETLESVFYQCPICKSFSTLHSHDNHLKCSSCSLDIEYTEDLRLKSSHPNFLFNTVYDWYRYQEKNVVNLPIEKGIDIFIDDAVILKKVIKGNHKQDILEGKIHINDKRILLENDKINKEFLFSDIVSLAVVYHNRLIINLEHEMYQVISDVNFNALKYVHVYFYLKNKEKGEKNEFLGI